MIVSASRRTDIPAFHLDWFLERLREGFVMVRNTRFPNHVAHIALDREAVEGIVFWTKDARPLLARLEALRAFPFYVQYTVTPYDARLEPGVPALAERIATFRELSGAIGPDRVTWRYDPIVYMRGLGTSGHIESFRELAGKLGPGTRRCVVSLHDDYPRTRGRLKHLEIRSPSDAEARELLADMARTAASLGFELETCAEAGDYDELGIAHGRCVDGRILSKIVGHPFPDAKDAGQRSACRCIPSIDIGAYDTCFHGCLYCYANGSDRAIARSRQASDPASPLLCDRLRPDDIVVERPARRLIDAQGSLDI